MTSYNLKTENGQLSFQPKRDYKAKVIFFSLAAAALFMITPMLSLYPEIRWGVMIIGLVAAFTAGYDFLFHFKVTYLFDPYTRNVYRKIPGLYTRRLMTFEEVFLLPVQEDGLLHYALAHKENKYGKSYTISQPFGRNRKSKKRQEIFETAILPLIENMIGR